jgi:hypothetical protein
MGMNMNLCDLLGVPDELNCPKCKETISTYFDDYDIDFAGCYSGGKWRLRVHCPECDCSWKYCFKIKLDDVESYCD